MKLKLLFLLSLILVISCNNKSNSKKINNYLYENEIPNDFNFIINNGGIDSYDSKSMNLYREFTDSIYKIKIPIDLVEKQLIYKKYVDLDFQSWTERMQTPEYAITTIRDLQSKASEQVQRYYQIKADGSFSSDVAYIVLSK